VLPKGHSFSRELTWPEKPSAPATALRIDGDRVVLEMEGSRDALGALKSRSPWRWVVVTTSLPSGASVIFRAPAFGTSTKLTFCVTQRKLLCAKSRGRCRLRATVIPAGQHRVNRRAAYVFTAGG
jgi:hypothetical protein